jgi:hypothetical protein
MVAYSRHNYTNHGRSLPLSFRHKMTLQTQATTCRSEEDGLPPLVQPPQVLYPPLLQCMSRLTTFYTMVHKSGKNKKESRKMLLIEPCRQKQYRFYCDKKALHIIIHEKNGFKLKCERITKLTPPSLHKIVNPPHLSSATPRLVGGHAGREDRPLDKH